VFDAEVVSENDRGDTIEFLWVTAHKLRSEAG
jgi:hypothetical protein